MKTIGLIGGTSWTSTIEYYRYLNEETARRLGGLHSAKIILASIDFAELEQAIHADRWGMAADILSEAAIKITKAGADFILLCSNTIHKLFDEVQSATHIPLIHMCDALSAEINAKGYSTVGLLGTKPTMEEKFYRDRIEGRCGAKIIVPSAEEKAYVDTAIFDRMCRNIYTGEDRLSFAGIISGLKRQGANAVILGCTEIPVLLKEAQLPMLNSTFIHSIKAVEWALSEQDNPIITYKKRPPDSCLIRTKKQIAQNG